MPPYGLQSLLPLIRPNICFPPGKIAGGWECYRSDKMTQQRKHVEIFTDGACSGNPGPGGWGAVLRYKGNTRELSGGERETTNNRMELTAVIEALSALKEPCDVTLTSDSKYVIDASRRDGSTAGRKKAGSKATKSQPSMWTCGNSCSRSWPTTRWSLSGSKATPGIRRTSAATRWRWPSRKNTRDDAAAPWQIGQPPAGGPPGDRPR